MYNKFYTFTSKGTLSTLYGELKVTDDVIAYNEGIHDGVDLLVRMSFGEYPNNIEFPAEFIVEGGSKLRDVIETRTPWLTIISDHVKHVFEDNGLTGWKSYDVIVRRKKSGEEISGFNGFSIIGRLSEKWDSEDVELPDFFRVLPRFPICSQRVIDILKKNKITCFNTRLIDKQRCEGILGIGKDFGHQSYTYSNFFERIYKSLISDKQSSSVEKVTKDR